MGTSAVHSAMTDGYHLGFAVGAGFALVGALVALTVLRGVRPRRSLEPAAAESAG